MNDGIAQYGICSPLENQFKSFGSLPKWDVAKPKKTRIKQRKNVRGYIMMSFQNKHRLLNLGAKYKSGIHRHKSEKKNMADRRRPRGPWIPGTDSKDSGRVIHMGDLELPLSY